MEACPKGKANKKHVVCFYKFGLCIADGVEACYFALNITGDIDKCVVVGCPQRHDLVNKVEAVHVFVGRDFEQGLQRRVALLDAFG